MLFASVNPFSPTGMRRVDPIPLRILDPLTAELADTQLGGMPEGLTLQKTYSLSTDGRWLGAAFLHPKYADNASHVRVWDMRRHERTRRLVHHPVPHDPARDQPRWHPHLRHWRATRCTSWTWRSGLRGRVGTRLGRRLAGPHAGRQDPGRRPRYGGGTAGP